MAQTFTETQDNSGTACTDFVIYCDNKSKMLKNSHSPWNKEAK
jgi:hypothetical protein